MFDSRKHGDEIDITNIHHNTYNKIYLYTHLLYGTYLQIHRMIRESIRLVVVESIR